MKKITTVSAVLVLGLLAVSLSAQSNDMIDTILEEPRIRFDSAAYLVLAASGQISPEASPEEAIALLAEQGFLLIPSDGQVSAEVLSLLVVKSFKLPTGLMYGLFPGPRYAYRALVHHEAISAVGGPGRIMAGEEVLRVLNNTLELSEGELP